MQNISKMFLHSVNKDRLPLPEISVAPMKTAFTSGEVQVAIKQLQDNKNTGKDNIEAEQKKYWTENIAKRNSNNLWWNGKNWKTSNDINQGLLTVIQKPGKSKGRIENLRPITFYPC